MLKGQMGENAGIAGQSQLNQLALTQNTVVTIPGYTRFYIVLETGAVDRDAVSRQAASSAPTGSKAAALPSLEVLRQLIQLKQDLSAMHQQAATPAPTTRTPQ